MKFKKNIAVDFDGVLNNYNGYDPKDLKTPRTGAKEFLQKLSMKFTIIIYSSRDSTNIRHWLEYYQLDVYVKEVTNKKPPAVAYIDDRAVNFDGDYEKVLNILEDFKTYWE